LPPIFAQTKLQQFGEKRISPIVESASPGGRSLIAGRAGLQRNYFRHIILWLIQRAFLRAFTLSPFVLQNVTLHFSDDNPSHRGQAEKPGGIP
jgi:hypothetical protein